MSTTWSALVTWSTGSLQLNNPANGFVLVSWSSGTIGYRRDEAEPSQFLHGKLYNAHVKDEATRLLVVRVIAPSLSQWVARKDILLDAVSHINYTVVISANGVTIDQWNYCQPAQIEMVGIGGESDKGWLGFDAPQPQQEYALEIPSSPV
jgi:hypothetical protein